LTPSLKAISEHSHAAQMFEVTHCFRCGENASIDLTIQLLTVVLMAAISGPDRGDYVGAITQLDAGVQAEIAKIIQQVRFILSEHFLWPC
jgi:hypothetical protein